MCGLVYFEIIPNHDLSLIMHRHSFVHLFNTFQSLRGQQASRLENSNISELI